MKKFLMVLAAVVVAASLYGAHAMAEGIVTVYSPSPSGLADQIAAGFEAEYGIKVEQFQGKTGNILARLEAEAANPVADVVILASWSDGLRFAEQDLLEAYTPANADKMVDGFFNGKLVGYSASAISVIYNTTIYPELSADWDALADMQYKDDIVMPDPELSGSCKDFLSGYISTYGDSGWATWDALAAIGMQIPGANKASLAAVTTGEKGILVGGVDYNAYAAIAKGEPLALYYPASGTVVNPRPAIILQTAPNMENAKLYMDYLLSDEVQQMVVDAYLLAGRADFEYDNRATIDEIPQMDVDWNAMMEIAADSAQHLNEICAE